MHLARISADEGGDCPRRTLQSFRNMVGEFLQRPIALVTEQKEKDSRIDLVQPKFLARK